MKDFIKNLLIAVVGIVILYAGYLFWQNAAGLEPAIGLPERDITKLVESGNETEMPLKLPEGFRISIWAKNLQNARVLAKDGLGNYWVSRTSQGAVTMLEVKDGTVVSQNDVFRGLRKPHGLAIDPNNGTMLYIAEEHRISRIALYTEDSLHKIADLPSGGNHFTRTINFGPDGRLYVSMGSSCNVCEEEDVRRAAIYSMNPDGSDFKLYAKGLRNTVFFDWHPLSGKMWGTDMGRDLLGDNLPPEEINIIEENKDYGWPFCYGANIHDSNFDKNQYIRDPCADKAAAHIEMPAHSAPLGLAFVPGKVWPREYWYNLIVAFHGSWNRSEPTGYKLVRVIADDQGKYVETVDFVSGWLSGDNALGRPVDVTIEEGIVYVTDDKAGVIYKIEYKE